MIIRQAQLAELGRTRRAEFEERASEALAKLFSERAAAQPPMAWRALVHETVEQALRVGLNIDEDVLEFAVYAFTSSENPVTVILPEWFQKIAEDRTISPQTRLTAMSIACWPPEGQGREE